MKEYFYVLFCKKSVLFALHGNMGIWIHYASRYIKYHIYFIHNTSHDEVVYLSNIWLCARDRFWGILFNVVRWTYAFRCQKFEKCQNWFISGLAKVCNLFTSEKVYKEILHAKVFFMPVQQIGFHKETWQRKGTPAKDNFSDFWCLRGIEAHLKSNILVCLVFFIL